MLLSNLNSLQEINKEVIGLDIVSLSFAELLTNDSEHGFVKPMSVLKCGESGRKSMVNICYDGFFNGRSLYFFFLIERHNYFYEVNYH